MGPRARSKGASRATRGPVPGSPWSERRSTRRGRSWSSAPPGSWPARRPTGGRSGRRAGGGWSGRTARWRRPSRRAIPRACAGRSSTPPGATRSASGRRPRTPGTCCSSRCGSGDRPRAVVTTTPARNPLLEELVEAPGTVVTRATTAANRMHLAPGFVEAVTATLRRVEPRAGGARRRVRERRRRRALDAGDARRGAGAAADRAGPDRGRGRSAGDERRAGRRVRHHRRRGRDEGAAAGLAGRGDRRRQRRRALAAGVGRAGGGALPRPCAPTGWWPRSTRAATWSRSDPAASTRWSPFRAVRASRGKAVRAEPVAALYEQGRIGHRGVFRGARGPDGGDDGGGFVGGGSPDRVDALVWAITELMLDPAAQGWRRAFAGSEPATSSELVRSRLDGLADIPQGAGGGRRSRPRRRRRSSPSRAPAGRPGRRATPQTLTRVGFLGNPVAFRCVKIIAEAAAAVPVVVQDADAAVRRASGARPARRAQPGAGRGGAVRGLLRPPAACRATATSRRRASGPAAGRASSTCCGRTG